MKKIITLVLIIVMVLLSYAGNCQNTSKKADNNTGVKLSRVTAQQNSSRANNAFATDVKFVVEKNPNDTILSTIQDTLNRIAFQTAPKKFLGVESTKMSNRISLLALIFGFFAALFAWRGYVYQRRSANSLEQMENKRLPFMVFAKKIFDNILTIDIISDIEVSNYSESEKKEKRKGYHVEKAIDRLRMPEDLIDVKCYEIFSDEVYIKAINLKVSWKNYNKYVDELLSFYESGTYDSISISEQYLKLREKTMLLLQDFFNMEDLISDSINKGGNSSNEMQHYRYESLDLDESEEEREMLKKRIKESGSPLQRLMYGVEKEKPTPDAKMNFLSQLLLDFRRGQKEIILLNERNKWTNIDARKVQNRMPWLSECNILKYDIASFGFSLDIPMEPALKKMLKRRWNMGYGVFWDILFDFTDFDKRINRYTKKWPNATKELFHMVYKDYRKSLFHPIHDEPLRLWIYSDSYEGFWKKYEHNLMNGISTNSNVLIRYIYNIEIGIKRREMIEDEAFLKKECQKYAEDFYRYISFPCFIKERPTITDLIRAVVAEQNLNFVAMDICAGKWENGSVVTQLPAFKILPTLESFCIVKDGVLVVKTFEELKEKLAKDAFFCDYPLDTYDLDGIEMRYNEYIKKIQKGNNISYTTENNDIKY